MKKIVGIMLMLMPLVVCGQRHTDATVVGHVVERGSGEHVAYVNVYIKGTTIGTVTDGTGHFHIVDCPEGRQVLVVHGIGYKQTEQAIEVEAGVTLDETIVVERDAIDLQPVVVTSGRRVESRSEAATIVDVIGEEKIEQYGAANLAGGIGFGTGVRMENTCQNCGSNEVRINGLGGRYTQVLVDGHPVNSALASVYLMELLPSSMMERVEVMRGGGSALYGGGAIAGVVNVITKEPVRNMASVADNLSLIGGKAVDNNTAVTASVVNDSRRAGLLIYGQNRERMPYDRDGDGFSEIGMLKAKAVGMNGYVRTSDYSKLNIEYHNLYEYRRGGDRFDLPSPMAHISEGGEHNIDAGSVKWDMFSRNGRGHLELYAMAQHVDRQSYYGEREDGDPIGTAYGYTQGLTTSEGVTYAYSMERMIFMPSELTVGAEHSYDQLKDRSVDMSDTMEQRVNVASIFMQNEWHNHRWNIAVGLRADKHSMMSGVVASPRVSVKYAATEYLTARVGYSSGFRAPQLFDDDLHAGSVNGEPYVLTNAEGLKMERSHSLTLSTDWCMHIGGVETDMLVEAFNTTIRDAFANVWLYDDSTSGRRHYERRNEESLTVRGVNIELRMMPIQELRLQIGGTIQQSLYGGEGVEWSEGKHEKRMERAPNEYGYFTATYNLAERWTIGATGTFTGPMIVYHSVESGVEQVETPTFADVSIKVSHSIALGERGRLTMSAGIQNIFDSFQNDYDSGAERDSKYIYGPLLPRTIFASLKMTI